MSTFFLFFPLFTGGMMSGVFILPFIIRKIKLMFTINADQLVLQAEKREKLKSKKIRKSKAFKVRFKSILNTIKDASEQKETEIVVTNVNTCHTDREIRRALRERNFYTSIFDEKNNTMTVKW